MFLLWLDSLSIETLLGEENCLNEFMGEKKFPGTWLQVNDLTLYLIKNQNFLFPLRRDRITGSDLGKTRVFERQPCCVGNVLREWGE